MHGKNLHSWMALEHAVEDQVMQGKRCFEWITDDIVEIKSRQPLAFGKAIRMNDDERVQLLSLFPERREGRIGQFLSGDIGEDLDALELERLHAMLELFCCIVAFLCQ